FRIVRYYKPLIFFSLLSLLLALFGVLIGIPVIMEYMQYQYIYKIPTAILATGLEGLAVTLFSVGLILDALAYQRRMETEKTIQHYTRPRFVRAAGTASAPPDKPAA
ncbi:MAG: hypothetical protein K2O70_02840, partial [Desulfovibrionaceae bacterium]|nr:hypothetical protein [Desulfovibrionaceae bacterium]